MEVTLRPFTESDIPAVARHANNEHIAANLRNVFPYPYTQEDARAYLLSCITADEARQCVRAICVDGAVAGSIGIFLGSDVYEKSAELGYWLAEPFWGRGVMTQAVCLLCAQAFARYNIVRIHAEPFAYNTGSRRVLEKAGFSLEGVHRSAVYKNGKLYDACLYALLRGEERPC